MRLKSENIATICVICVIVLLVVINMMVIATDGASFSPNLSKEKFGLALFMLCLFFVAIGFIDEMIKSIKKSQALEMAKEKAIKKGLAAERERLLKEVKLQMMKEEQYKKICPLCGGRGRGEEGNLCSICGGTGVQREE